MITCLRVRQKPNASEREFRQRDTLQQFATSNFCLLVVDNDDPKAGIIDTLQDVPATNFEYG